MLLMLLKQIKVVVKWPNKKDFKGYTPKSPFNKGGMPMVKKDGKSIPAFAADGVGKMMAGGMAKKKAKK